MGVSSLLYNRNWLLNGSLACFNQLLSTPHLSCSSKDKLRSESLTECLSFSSLLVETHLLLPQLLFQRCQAAFLAQHATVPPAERQTHISQLFVCIGVCSWLTGQTQTTKRRSNNQREALGSNTKVKPGKAAKHPACSVLQPRKGCFEVFPRWRPDR